MIYSDSAGLWCTDFNNDRLWNVPDPIFPIVKYVKLPDGREPEDIDSFGNLWFSLFGRSSVMSFNPKLNELTEYKIPTPSSKPVGVVVDYSNRVWFAESATNKIGVFNPDSQTFVEYVRVTGSGSPTYLAAYRDDPSRPRRLPMLFSDSNFGKIGRIEPHEGLTTVPVQYITPVTTTSSTGISTSTLSTGTAGHFTYSYTTSGITASMTPADVVGTTFTVTETVRVLRTSSMDISTAYTTVTGTTSTLTTATGTYTSYVATVTGTATTTSYATSTSYVGTTTRTLTTFKTTTVFTTALETTTTGMIIVPGYRPTAIFLGVLLGIISLLSFRISRRAKHGRLRILQNQKGNV